MYIYIHTCSLWLHSHVGPRSTVKVLNHGRSGQRIECLVEFLDGVFVRRLRVARRGPEVPMLGLWSPGLVNHDG